MSSVATAHLMTREVADWLAPSMPGKVKLDKLHREIAKRLPSISRRRVRALFFGEAARIDFDEMRALAELRAEEELRRARRQLAANANILATHHAATGSPLDRDTIDALSRLARLVDISRDGGDAR